MVQVDAGVDDRDHRSRAARAAGPGLGGVDLIEAPLPREQGVVDRAGAGRAAGVIAVGLNGATGGRTACPRLPLRAKRRRSERQVREDREQDSGQDTSLRPQASTLRCNAPAARGFPSVLRSLAAPPAARPLYPKTGATRASSGP